MRDPFANAAVQLLGYPLMLTLVGMYTRRLGRRDGDPSPRRNDWAIGTTLLFMTFGVVVSDMRVAPVEADVSPGVGWLLIVLLGLVISLDIDRTHSWARDAGNRMTDRKRLGVGIIGPNILALGIYCSYQIVKTWR
ncbi:MAG TPA: hypothetical protein VGB24_16300 [Longimicrobium sp.]|jgi:hypothetical protein|uniref:hypothetical protein n=1 Tax=Longimicrobium sp. TaxID=2029185 RepID=UPI002EDA5E59